MVSPISQSFRGLSGAIVVRQAAKFTAQIPLYHEFYQIWCAVANVIISEYKLQSGAFQNMISRTSSSEMPGLGY